MTEQTFVAGKGKEEVALELLRMTFAYENFKSTDDLLATYIKCLKATRGVAS